ncbi:MAG: hypothetical protein AB8H80_18160 [Planctomycetota bacterium]
MAQSPVADLESGDWQVRNRVARNLATADAVDVPALVRVLSRDWQGKLPTYSIGRGAVGMRANPTEPRAVVRTFIYDTVYRRSTDLMVADPRDLSSNDDLCCPLHPHDLVLFVLRVRDERLDHVALGLDAPERGEAWLLLVQPGRDELLEEMVPGDATDAIVAGLWRLGEAGKSCLRDLLVEGPVHVQRAIVRLGRSSLVANDDAVRVVAGLLAASPLAGDRTAAAGVLITSDRDVAEVVGDVLATTESRSGRGRLLALLAVLGERSRPATAQLVERFEDARRNRRSALYAVSSFDPAPEGAAVAAAGAFALLSDRDRITRALAADVLGRCGAGVDAEMRAEMQKRMRGSQYEDQPPRLLAALRKLGAVPKDMTLADKLAMLEMSDATAGGVWLAIADEGRDGGGELLQPLLDVGYGVSVEGVLERLMQTAPDLMREWLADKDPEIQALGLRALRTADDASVSTEQLVKLLDNHKLADTALGWLISRSDASKHVAAVFARICANHAEKPGVRPFAGSVRLTGAEEAFVQQVKMPPTLKLSLLEPLLARGAVWETVRGLDPELMRKDLRRWLARSEDFGVRAKLLGELCRLGLRSDAEIAMVAAVLAGEDRSPVLRGLSEGPDLPRELLAPLYAIFDAELDGWDSAPWEAREVLWTFRKELASKRR